MTTPDYGPVCRSCKRRHWGVLCPSLTAEPDALILDDIDQPERPGDRERVAKWFDQPVVNRGPKQEPEGQSGLPRFNRYSIPATPDPLAVDCPYCVKRPRNLAAHCRAVHPDKPEARR